MSEEMGIVGSAWGIVKDIVGINPVEARNRWLNEWAQQNAKYEDWRSDDWEQDMIRREQLRQNRIRTALMTKEMEFKTAQLEVQKLNALARLAMAQSKLGGQASAQPDLSSLILQKVESIEAPSVVLPSLEIAPMPSNYNAAPWEGGIFSGAGGRTLDEGGVSSPNAGNLQGVNLDVAPVAVDVPFSSGFSEAVAAQVAAITAPYQPFYQSENALWEQGYL